jgi:hypothetical protein
MLLIVLAEAALQKLLLSAEHSLFEISVFVLHESSNRTLILQCSRFFVVDAVSKN